jgi:hypothetical protein
MRIAPGTPMAVDQKPVTTPAQAALALANAAKRGNT